MSPRHVTLVAGLALAATLTACGGDAADTASASTTTLAVTASDDACQVDATEIEAGTIEFEVTNTGRQVTEVYVYGEEDRVFGEVENVTPGVRRSFQVTVAGGEYQIACKPGQTGDGIRTALTVTGAALDEPTATRDVVFTAVDYAYEGLEDASFTAGDVIEFEMTNTGTVEHEFEVFGPDGPALGEIGPTPGGEVGKVALTLGEAGTYRYVCGIEGHEELGMAGEFTVTAGS